MSQGALMCRTQNTFIKILLQVFKYKIFIEASTLCFFSLFKNLTVKPLDECDVDWENVSLVSLI